MVFVDIEIIQQTKLKINIAFMTTITAHLEALLLSLVDTISCILQRNCSYVTPYYLSM